MRTKSEIQADLDKAKRKLASAKEDNLTDMVKLNEGKIEKYNAELAKVDEKPEIDEMEAQYNKAPKEVQSIIDEIGDDNDYKAFETANTKLKPLGYELLYGLGGVTGLKKITKAKKATSKKKTSTKGKKTTTKKRTTPNAWDKFQKENMGAYQTKFGKKEAIKKMSEAYQAEKAGKKAETKEVKGISGIVVDLYEKINGKKEATSDFESVSDAIESANLNTTNNDKYAEVYEGAIYKGFSQKGKFTKKEHKPTSTNRKIGTYHELIDSGKDVYVLKNTKTDKAEFEIEKNAAGKFKVTCLTKEDKLFDSLEEALDHIRKTFLKGELGKIMEEKKHKAVIAKAWKEKHKSGELTAVETMKKAEEKVDEKLEEKIEKGESVEGQVKQLLKIVERILAKISKLTGENYKLSK